MAQQQQKPDAISSVIKLKTASTNYRILLVATKILISSKSATHIIVILLIKIIFTLIIISVQQPSPYFKF